MPEPPVVTLDLPAWIDELVDWTRPLRDPEARMALAIALARENVVRGAGGPFGALIVERDSGRLVSVGVNGVVRLSNATAHAEMVAFQFAQRRLRSFTLGAPDMPAHELVTSCEPCAMCLGATLWSGVRSVVCGAAREDALHQRFDEGPVFPESWRYLESHGISITRGVRREEARKVLELYGERSGEIYNA